MNPRDVMNLAPVIPVLAFESVEQALEQSQALVAGGLPVLEITLRGLCIGCNPRSGQRHPRCRRWGRHGL